VGALFTVAPFKVSAVIACVAYSVTMVPSFTVPGGIVRVNAANVPAGCKIA